MWIFGYGYATAFSKIYPVLGLHRKKHFYDKAVIRPLESVAVSAREDYSGMAGIRTLLYLAVIAFISACDTRSRDLLGSTMNLTTWAGSNT